MKARLFKKKFGIKKRTLKKRCLNRWNYYINEMSNLVRESNHYLSRTVIDDEQINDFIENLGVEAEKILNHFKKPISYHQDKYFIGRNNSQPIRVSCTGSGMHGWHITLSVLTNRGWTVVCPKY